MTTDVIIISIVILLVLLLLILLFLLLNLQKQKTKRPTSNHRGTHLVNITGLSLPTGIEKIPPAEIRGAIPSKIFRVFENLEYKKNANNFHKAQWHSWQVGILLRLYKMDLDFHITSPSKSLPNEILNIDDKGLRQIVNDIMIKYRRDVEITRSKDSLCKDLIWTGREVAILFYFLSKYKGFPKGLR